MKVSEGKSLPGFAAGMMNKLTGIRDAIAGVLESVSFLVYPLFYSLFGIGLALSIWLPFIPMIYWFVAMADWLVTLMTGVLASSCGQLPISTLARVMMSGVHMVMCSLSM